VKHEELQQPHSLPNEKALLAACLQEPATIGSKVHATFGSENPFWDPRHAAIYKAAASGGAIGWKEVDLVSIADKLPDPLEGMRVIREIRNSLPTVANLETYLQKVGDYHSRRKLIKAFEVANTSLYKAEKPVSEVTAAIEGELRNLASYGQRGSVMTVAEAWELRKKILVEPRTFLTLGYDDITTLTGAVEPGSMVILAARPSMGKTALAACMLYELANQGLAAGYFTLEMGADQLVDRLVCALSKTDTRQLRDHLGEDAVIAAGNHIASLPICFDQQPGIRFSQLAQQARRWKADHNISYLFVDYLQLITSDSPHLKREQQVAEMSKAMKELCRELKVVGIVLCQLNRAAAESEKGPQTHQLRESGALEQDADVVLLMTREDPAANPELQYSIEKGEAVDCWIRLGKVRGGAQGQCVLRYYPKYSYFSNHKYGSKDCY